MQIDIRDAKKRFYELLKRVAEGDEIVIADSGKPLAKLVGAETNAAVLSDDARDARDRKLRSILCEIDRIPERPDAFDPLEWDEWGLPK